MIQKVLFIELHYLPCIKYYVYLNSFKKILISPVDAYSKQTYRNRCRINGANKIENLIIPTRKISGIKMLTCDVKIDYNQKWLSKHIRAIKSAYGKSPFFEYYFDDFIEIYNRKHELLIDLNKSLLTKCLDILGLDIEIDFVTKIGDLEKNNVYNAINSINPKKSKPENYISTPEEYLQVFGNKFVDNLSIIDLIFCEGPQAKTLIDNRTVRASVEKIKQDV